MKKRNRKWKCLWAWCLVLTLLCGTMAEGQVARAATVAEGHCGENSWMLDADGVLHLSGEGTFAEYSRDEVPWQWVKDEIRQVSFETSTVTGGDLRYYFSDCRSLEEVNSIPEGVTGLNAAFEGCTKLRTVGTISSTVQSMCDTFKNCTSLNVMMTLPERLYLARGTFEGCTALTKAPVIKSEELYDMTRCFYECSSMTEAPELPDSVKNMGYCFYSCEQLEYAPVLPKKVEDIRYTFWHCINMKTAPDIPLYVKYMQHCMVECKSVSGEMTIYPLIKKKENYTNFAGETEIYDVSKNPKFLGGIGTGLRVHYTNRNQKYIQPYLGEGWNSGGIWDLHKRAGMLAVGDMITAQMEDCEVESVGVETYDGTEICPKPKVTYGYETLVEGEDFTYGYEDNVNTGIATLTVGGTEEFEGEIKLCFEILPRRFEQIKASGYTGVYDGNPHSISIQCDEGAKIEYGTEEGHYITESCPKYLMPGNYTTYYQVSKANYVTETGCEQVVILPETLSVEAQGFCGEYDGNPHSIHVKTDPGATIRYGTMEGEYVTAVCPTYVNTGKYTVYYEVAKPGYRTWTGKEEVTIQPKKMTEIPLPNVGRTIPGVQLENLDMSGESTQYGKFVWDNPKEFITEGVRIYAMRFIPTDSENFDWSAMEGYRADTKDVLIHCLIDAVSYPTAKAIRYGTKLGESTLEAEEKDLECSWKNPETIPQKSGYYEVVLQIGNRNWVRQIWLEVEKATPQCDTPQLEEISYTEQRQLKNVPLPDGWSWMYPEQILSEEISGYEAVFVPVDTEHYCTVQRMIPLKTRKVTVVETDSLKSEEKNHETSDGTESDYDKSVSAVTGSENELLFEGEEYNQKITQWIQKIDQNGKKTAKVKIKKVLRKGKKITVTWKKIKEATGYQVMCTPRKAGKKAAIKKYKKKNSVTFCAKKTMKYRIKVRAVFRTNGKNVYGVWSKKKSV